VTAGASFRRRLIFGSLLWIAGLLAMTTVIGLTLTASRDLAPLGIRVMCIAPGTFLTPAYGNVDPAELNAKWGAMVPNPRRMGHADEYARLAAHIVDNDFLNGTTIRIDGAQRFGLK